LPALLALTLFWARPAEASRWGKGYFPEVTLLTHTGQPVRFYDDLVKDRIFVISFLYTTCRDLCPLATARLAELQEKLGSAMGRDIFFYSLSIDPETDTPDRLKQYAETFGAGPGWLFLTGRPEDVRALRHKLGDRSTVLSDHRNEVLLGNGATGEWARNNVLGDINSLALAVRAMDPAWRPGAATAGRTQPGLIDIELRPGQALFKRLCAGCHTVGKGDRVGPDLAGVTARRDRDWLVRFITGPETMRRQQDPIALDLARRYPTVRMPAIGLAETDARDLLAYLAPPPPAPLLPTSRPLAPLAALTDQHGTRFALERLEGRPVVLFFGFTHCPDVCPTTLLDWSNVLASLGPDADRLAVVFVAVDSERDTPQALKEYMASFDRRIVALTGGAADIAAAARPFDAFYEKVADGSGGYTFDHTVKVYLLDSQGRPAGAVDLRTSEADRRKALSAVLGD
jgi:protein SCO1/2